MGGSERFFGLRGARSWRFLCLYSLSIFLASLGSSLVSLLFRWRRMPLKSHNHMDSWPTLLFNAQTAELFACSGRNLRNRTFCVRSRSALMIETCHQVIKKYTHALVAIKLQLPRT